MTPLLYSIFNNHTKIAKKLIDLGADVNEPDNDGKTPLMYASDNCNLDLIDLLIKKGANIEAKYGSLTAFLIAYSKIKDNNDTCHQAADLLYFEEAKGGRRRKRRTTKKNRRVAKSKRYTRAKQ